MNKLISYIACYMICIHAWAQVAQNTDKSSLQECSYSYDLYLIDSCTNSALGKDTTTIILNADSIIATTVSWDECVADTMKLSKIQEAIVQYTFCNSYMYETNRKVYASFQPYVKLDFYSNKKQLTIFFDYGLNKWMIKGENKITICHDLKFSALLPLFYTMFKNNKLIQQSYKKLMQ